MLSSIWRLFPNRNNFPGLSVYSIWRLRLTRRVLLSSILGCVLYGSSTEFNVGKEKVPPTKSIRGHVTDRKKNSIIGAKVFIKNLNKKTTTILVTDQNGLYSVFGLDPKADYEVHAEHGRFVSETRTASSFLDRFDNVFNFELSEESGFPIKRISGGSVKKAIELHTPDQVKILGDWHRPSSKTDQKLAAVLLLHGFGEERSVWEGFISEHLLKNDFAVLNIDLRGHGASALKGEEKLIANRSWLTDSKQFPLDLEAAVNWLKSQNEVDQNRIAVVGGSLGANLAYVASGKYEAIRSAVALSGSPQDAKMLARDCKNFQPHSILYIATQGDDQSADFARQFERLTGFPVRVQIYENSNAHGSRILQEIPEAAALVTEWLKNTL